MGNVNRSGYFLCYQTLPDMHHSYNWKCINVKSEEEARRVEEFKKTMFNERQFCIIKAPNNFYYRRHIRNILDTDDVDFK